MYQVVYSEHARKDLKNLELTVARRIIKKIAFYAMQDTPLSFAKPLKNLGEGKYRFRIGDYRAIFSVDKNGELSILFILKIRHRKDVYFE